MGSHTARAAGTPRACLPNADIGTLALRDWQNLPRPARASASTPAASRRACASKASSRAGALPILWLRLPRSAAAASSIAIGPPSQLGADRWALLVAARRRVLASEPSGVAVRRRQCGHRGHHRRARRRRRVPGRRHRAGPAPHAAGDRRARARRSRSPPGELPRVSRRTRRDALASGAIAGRVRRDRADAHRRLRRDEAAVRCYLTGGAAHEIAPHLTGPLEVVDNLVLEGVLALAGEHE